jgi:general L-amino acid transport system permease protein
MTAPPAIPASPPKTRDWSLRSRHVRGLLYQVLALSLIGLAIWFLAHNTLTNMRARGIQSGFDFLASTAGFDIGEKMIPYESTDPYWMAFLIGILNTLRVAVLGIVLTTLLGTLWCAGCATPMSSFSAMCRSCCSC